MNFGCKFNYTVDILWTHSTYQIVNDSLFLGIARHVDAVCRVDLAQGWSVIVKDGITGHISVSDVPGKDRELHVLLLVLEN